MDAEAPADAAGEFGDEDRGAGAAAGAARPAAVAVLRSGYIYFLKTLGRYAASPHKLFRPENPSISRFEDAFDVLWGKNAVNSRGMYSLWRTHGFRQALVLKGRNVAVNSVMGTALFATYDLARGAGADGAPPAVGRTAASAALAGGLHGALCAPLEVASRRILAAGRGQGRVLREAVDAVRQPVPTAPTGDVPRRRMLAGALMPLGVLRDSAGICAFFVTFETLQQRLHAESERRWGRGDEERLRVTGRVVGTLLGGGCAGVAYRVISWPFDQLLVRSTADCEFGGPLKGLLVQTSRLVHEAGLRRALLPPGRAVLSAFPTSALGLLVYEWLR